MANCLPATIYLWYSVVYVALMLFARAQQMSLADLLSKYAVALLFSAGFIWLFWYLLHYLCKSGYQAVSWVLLLVTLLMNLRV